MLPFATVGDNERPVWSADGTRIIFASTRAGGAMNLYTQAADGTGPVERLSESPYMQLPAWASPDRSGVLDCEDLAWNAGDIVWFPLKGPSGVSQPSGAAGTNASTLERLIHTAGIDYNSRRLAGRPVRRVFVERVGKGRKFSSSASSIPSASRRRPVARLGRGRHAARLGARRHGVVLHRPVERAHRSRSAACCGRPTFERRTKLFAVPSGPYGPRGYDPPPNARFVVVRGNQPDDERTSSSWS